MFPEYYIQSFRITWSPFLYVCVSPCSWYSYINIISLICLLSYGSRVCLINLLPIFWTKRNNFEVRDEWWKLEVCLSIYKVYETSLLVSNHACCGWIRGPKIDFVRGAWEVHLPNAWDHTTRPIEIFQYENRIQASFAALKLDTSSVPNNNHKTVF